MEKGCGFILELLLPLYYRLLSSSGREKELPKISSEKYQKEKQDQSLSPTFEQRLNTTSDGINDVNNTILEAWQGGIYTGTSWTVSWRRNKLSLVGLMIQLYIIFLIIYLSHDLEVKGHSWCLSHHNPKMYLQTFNLKVNYAPILNHFLTDPSQTGITRQIIPVH